MHRHSHPGQHASQCALPGCHARLALENTVTTTEGQRPTALARLVLGSASPHPAREVGPEFGQLGVSHHRPPATHPPGIEPAGTSPSAPVLVIPAAAHNAALSLTRRSPKRNQSTEAWREGESGFRDKLTHKAVTVAITPLTAAFSPNQHTAPPLPAPATQAPTSPLTHAHEFHHESTNFAACAGENHGLTQKLLHHHPQVKSQLQQVLRGAVSVSCTPCVFALSRHDTFILYPVASVCSVFQPIDQSINQSINQPLGLTACQGRGLDPGTRVAWAHFPCGPPGAGP